MTRLLFFTLLGIAILPACSSNKNAAKTSGTAPGEGITWVKADQLSTVLEQAKAEKKAVFVECFATWCGPCKMMDKQVFRKKVVYDYLNAHFLNYHLDVDQPEGKKIAGKYKVLGIPTVLFLDPDGKVLKRQVGLMDEGQFQDLSEEAFGKMGG
jgi:thiol:disulfide interchange protein